MSQFIHRFSKKQIYQNCPLDKYDDSLERAVYLFQGYHYYIVMIGLDDLPEDSGIKRALLEQDPDAKNAFINLPLGLYWAIGTEYHECRDRIIHNIHERMDKYSDKDSGLFGKIIQSHDYNYNENFHFIWADQDYYPYEMGRLNIPIGSDPTFKKRIFFMTRDDVQFLIKSDKVVYFAIEHNDTKFLKLDNIEIHQASEDLIESPFVEELK